MIALRQFASRLVADQTMMCVSRRWQLKQHLKYTLHMGCGKQIIATCNEGDLLKRIIHHDREMVRCGQILSGQDDVAGQQWIDGD